MEVKGAARKKVPSPIESHRLKTEKGTEMSIPKEDVIRLQLKLQRKIAEEDALRRQIDTLLEENRKLSHDLAVNRSIVEADKKIINDLENRIKQKSETLKSELICPICNEIFVKATALNKCAHIFCESCLDLWIENQSCRFRPATCPMCRSLISGKTRLREMDSYIDKMIDSSPEMKKSRQSLIADRLGKPVQEVCTPVEFPELELDRSGNANLGRVRVVLRPTSTESSGDLEVAIVEPSVNSVNSINELDQRIVSTSSPVLRGGQPAGNQNAGGQPRTVSGTRNTSNLTTIQQSNHPRTRRISVAGGRQTPQRQRTNIQRQPWRY